MDVKPRCLDKVISLINKGVDIPNPLTIDVGDDVNTDRISGKGVRIYPGCRIYGKDTAISAGSQIGCEGPVTIDNCQLGPGVELKGGYFNDSVFLEKAGMGSGAQVREGCILEEGARCAHNVGLKYTILFPYVTLGSLINFCDCLMAGGTDEKNHSEVGSSYIHFNYTPDQDKATASLIGDVPRGVMINQPPIFLGGQGGAVGPVILEYGTVVAAGAIIRKDILKKKHLLLGSQSLSKMIPFQQGQYHNIKRIIRLNINYIANLISLRRWYMDIRSLSMGPDEMEVLILKGALDKLEKAVKERVKRLAKVAEKAHLSKKVHGEMSPADALKDALYGRWPEIEEIIRQSLLIEGDRSKRDIFVGTVNKNIIRDGKNYLAIIKKLTEKESIAGTQWLQGIVDDISHRALALLPGMEEK
jgi:bifunctional UDP-N-acetylglucosamine pyrophosphorylase / glucosamine-1-phosphate N-acetyltransferase